MSRQISANINESDFRRHETLIIFIAKICPMEEKANPGHKRTAPAQKKHKQEVYILRDLREYLGESLLIIFSVLLALFLTEFINNLHEKSQTRELMEILKTNW